MVLYKTSVFYKGVAKYKGGFDVSKPYTPVGFEESWRQVSDTCKNNFATLNPLGVIQVEYDGNLKTVGAAIATGWFSTFSSSYGRLIWKMYCEIQLLDGSYWCMDLV